LSAISLYAREAPGHDQRVLQALRVLQEGAAAYPGAIVQATSLGAEDMVVTDLIARHRLPIAVATLDTGMLHAETLELLPAIRARYGMDVERWAPRTESVVHFVNTHGERAMYASIELRKACCGLRKLEPLGRMLAARSAWVTGLRREQSGHRGTLETRQRDDAGRVKLNPLADWSQADVWHYIERHAVPYNALHDRFYPSIGCAPCTRAVAVGEDIRAGRWWWEDEAAKECGLHVEHPATSSINAPAVTS
jgi:phosphoadenosine phosphosulfate reductase